MGVYQDEIGRQHVQAAREPDAARQVAELEQRHVALRQAASLPAADLSAVLDAAFAELEGAIGLLSLTAVGQGDAASGRAQDPDGTERRLLRATFTDVPVPLFLLARDGTVLRVNRAAADMLGSKPGYATGRPFAAFVAMPSRAAVQTQLTAVIRSGRVAKVRCGLLVASGAKPGLLAIGKVAVSGEADRLVVAVAEVPENQDEAEPAPPAPQSLPEEIYGPAREVYALLGPEPKTVETIAGECQLGLAQIQSALTQLEIYGLIKGHPGRRFGL